MTAKTGLGSNRAIPPRSDVVVLACRSTTSSLARDDVRRAARREGSLPDHAATSYSQSTRFDALTTAGDAQ